MQYENGDLLGPLESSPEEAMAPPERDSALHAMSYLVRRLEYEQKLRYYLETGEDPRPISFRPSRPAKGRKTPSTRCLRNPAGAPVNSSITLPRTGFWRPLCGDASSLPRSLFPFLTI